MPVRKMKSKTGRRRVAAVSRGAKSKSRKTSKSKPKSTAPVSQSKMKSHFMWKLLAQKKERDKNSSAKSPVTANPFARVRPLVSAVGFGRFAGPRRRAG